MNTDSQNYPDNGSPEFHPEDLPGSGVENQPPNAAGSKSNGTRHALCIGINQYSSSPLFGCVSDARRWHAWFESEGFQTQLLTDGDATRDSILDKIGALVSQSEAGDVIAIQYSGHGTQMPDLNGDEMGGDTPAYDEALVPFDHLSNGYVIDDDLAEICNAISDTVNVTFFFDCCHSGTATRKLMEGRSRSTESDSRPRYLAPTQEMIDVHMRTRQASRGISSTPDNYHEILFAACRSNQLAWESSGQGDFTRLALGILAQNAGSLTNNDFLSKVNEAFGTNPRQNPDITCQDNYRTQILLAPRGATSGSEPSNPNLRPDLQTLLKELQSIIDRLTA